MWKDAQAHQCEFTAHGVFTGVRTQGLTFSECE